MGLVLSITDKDFSELLQDFYDVMKQEKQEEAAMLADIIDTMKKDIRLEEVLIKADLLTIRYQVMQGELQPAGYLLEEFEERGHDLSQQNEYFYKYFKGQVLFKKKRWKEALRYYEQAELYITEDEEKADFYYKLSHAYYRTGIPALSVLNANKALRYAASYKQQYHLAKCKLLLGLNHLEIRNFEQAEFLLYEALDSQHNIDETSLDLASMVHHNLGLLHFVQRKFEKAVDYFDQAVHATPCSHYLKSLYYLTESLFRVNHHSEAMKYYQIGLTKSKEKKDMVYQWAFAMLHKQFVDCDNFEAVWAEGIAFYKEIDDSESVHYYSLRMADYYTLKGEEEKANYYYRLAVL
ncbi:tetratricopeptide repeat protein [Terribacillus saccharophilus]|uniref:Response regulator aspartate phosphatase C n=1 Tax=Terribacillus saccharophilus TaxID=361277 RepID=A0AAX2EIJ3_9BACI|nr:tetratricopeptide repeat protein [Terribacillus goriensis]SEN87601.1 response regulator aspartate phosphatase C [Terribacillus saccharophilus]